jgi:hypothetical protein
VKKYLVSLNVTSTSMSLEELSLRLGRPSARDGSHSKGDAHPGGYAWSETLWRLDSDAPETAPLIDLLESLAREFAPKELRQVLPPECEATINIAILFDTYTVSALIPRRGTQIIDSYNARLELLCYPTDFGAQE